MSARNSSSGIVPASIVFDSSMRPRHQVVITPNTRDADREREPAAVGDLGGVGGEEREVDDEERDRNASAVRCESSPSGGGTPGRTGTT